MKKGMFILVIIAIVTLALTGLSYSWQGRMSGIADPYGLTPDESDFLIHPALIANGQGLKVYSNFDFTYTGISEWDMDFEVTSSWWESFDASGDRQDYSALLGSAFSVGTGRLGIFFSYDGSRQDIDGDADYRPSGSSNPATTAADYDLNSDMDDFSMRFIYGLPVNANCLNIGGEVKISYREEDQKNKWANNDGQTLINLPMASTIFWMESNMLWFQIPYDSDYWDAQFKGSVNGQICPGGIDPIDITLSLGGGFIFAGDNEYKYEGWDSGGNSEADLDGDVDGWNIGGDLWIRMPVSDSLTLPFLVRVEYREKTRDGKGELSDDAFMPFVPDGLDISYDHEEESFLVEVGGGIDTKLSDSSMMAAGIFYTYLDNSDTVTFNVADSGLGFKGVYDDSSPDYKEHRISLKMGWETSLSDSTAVRAGFTTFYGFIDKDFVYDYTDNFNQYQKDVADLNGHQWGIMASVGGTFKLQSVTLEPYANAGYRDLELDGDEHSKSNFFGPSSFDADMDESRQEWFVGCGLSILFGN